MDLTLYGVTMKAQEYPICYKSANGGLYKNAFAIMNNFVLYFAKPVNT